MPKAFCSATPGAGSSAYVAYFIGHLTVDPTSELIEIDTVFVGGFYGNNYEYVGEGGAGGGTFQINDGINSFSDDVDNVDGDAIFIGQR